MSKLTVLVILLSIILVFTFQNTESVEIVFWPWKITMSKALLSLGAFLFGLILGFIIGSLRKG
ncbi:MAG: LapA family protein [Deltaproteobacteria bacterium]|nr:LapA family protein [Deltaproteobacteria bacterium]